WSGASLALCSRRAERRAFRESRPHAPACAQPPSWPARRRRRRGRGRGRDERERGSRIDGILTGNRKKLVVFDYPALKAFCDELQFFEKLRSPFRIKHSEFLAPIPFSQPSAHPRQYFFVELDCFLKTLEADQVLFNAHRSRLRWYVIEDINMRKIAQRRQARSAPSHMIFRGIEGTERGLTEPKRLPAALHGNSEARPA